MPDMIGASVAARQVLRRLGYLRAVDVPNGSPLAHRGGGAYLAPENTLASVHSAFAQGIRVVNIDARSLGDGTLGLIHDATIDRTFTGNGNITDYSAASWITLNADISQWFGGGWRDGRGELFTEVVSAYGGQIVWVVEAFDAPGAIALARFARERSLNDSLIVSGRNLSWLPPVVSMGINAMFIHETGAAGSIPLGNSAPVEPADLVNAGIRYVTFIGGENADGANSQSGGAAASDVKRYADVGLKIDMHTLNRQVERRNYEGKGFSVWTWSCDDPVYALGQHDKPATLTYRRKADPFKSQSWYPGMIPVNGGSLAGRGKFVPPDRWGMDVAGFVLQGWGCPVQGGTTSGTVITTADLAAGTAYTSISVQPLAFNVPNGTKLALQTGGNGQTTTVANRTHLAGETLLAVSSVTPAVTIPAGTILQQEVTITGSLVFDTIPADTSRWVGVTFGMPTDRSYADNLDPRDQRYKLLFRANGIHELSKSYNGISTNYPGNPATQTAAGIGTIPAPLVTTAALASSTAITAIPVTALPVAISAGSRIALPGVTTQIATVATGGAALGATSVPINSITPTAAISSGASLPFSASWSVTMRPELISATVSANGVTRTLTWTDTESPRGPYFYVGGSNAISWTCHSISITGGQ